MKTTDIGETNEVAPFKLDLHCFYPADDNPPSLPLTRTVLG